MGRRVDVEKKLISHFKAPRADVLLVVHDEMKELSETKSGLVLPSSTMQSRNERVGTVVAIGSKIQEVKPGDRVLMDKRLGITLQHEDSETNRLVLVSEDQVLGILEGKPCDEDYDFVRDGIGA